MQTLQDFLILGIGFWLGVHTLYIVLYGPVNCREWKWLYLKKTFYGFWVCFSTMEPLYISIQW